MLARLGASIRRISTRLPWLGTALALAVYALGVVWRWLHIMHWHDPRKFVYSDMSLYVNLAKRFAKPGYEARINDITHPPGATLVYSHLYRDDQSMKTMVIFNFVMCALAPLAVALLGWVTFGKKNARIALVAATLYWPYVDYGGFFLSEMPFIVFIPLTLALAILAVRRRSLFAVAGLGLLAGVVFFFTIALKALALLAGGCAAVVLVALWRGAPGRAKAVVLLALALGAAPGTKWMADRCTKANADQFCLSNNKTSADVLIGHYGRNQVLSWKDPKGGTFTFGNPSDVQHGYTARPSVDFAMTDNKRNREAVIAFAKAHPDETIVLTLQHVYDMYSTLSWPSNSTHEWKVVIIFQYLFLLLIFFPACMRMVDILRRDGLRAFLRSNEVLVLSPFLGLLASVMIATGEPRYRIPFDSLFILVAIEFFRHWRVVPVTEPDDDAAGAAVEAG